MAEQEEYPETYGTRARSMDQHWQQISHLASVMRKETQNDHAIRIHEYVCMSECIHVHAHGMREVIERARLIRRIN